jgi:hypothetical protein
LPPADRRRTEISGISLPRLAIAKDLAALPGVLANLNSAENDWI